MAWLTTCTKVQN